MPEELKELLARVGELSTEELDELISKLTNTFDELDDEEAPNVDGMQEVYEALTKAKGEQDTRTEQAAESQRRAEELRSQMHAIKGEGEPEGGTDAEGDGTEGDAPDGAEGVEDAKGAEGKAEGKPAAPKAPAAPQGKSPVIGQKQAASNGGGATATARPSMAAMSQRRGDSNTPKGTDTLSSRGNLVAQIHVNKLNKRAGDVLDSRDQFTEAMVAAVNALGRGTGERITVARSSIEYPADRKLDGDAWSNSQKIDAVVDPQALVATGGICNPVDVDYSLMVISDDDEPVKGIGPSFNATRGGIRFVRPPSFASVGGSGTTYWSASRDAAVTFDGSGNPSDVKPVQTVSCGTEVEVFVDAIPTQLRFGNMMSRFSPEIIEANTKLALANAAAIRELHRLSVISSYSTAVSSGQLLGASRDLLATMDLLAVGIRRRHRVRRGTVAVRVVLPDWTIDLLRADLTRELAHGDSSASNMSLTDAQVETLLTSRGFAVTWTMDDPSGTLSGYTLPANLRRVQNAGPINDWPSNLVWWMFLEGTFQRLDGGTLDIGVVRDSRLNATNDYETFTEIFEGWAYRGLESMEIHSNLRPNGASAATVQTAPSPIIY